MKKYSKADLIKLLIQKDMIIDSLKSTIHELQQYILIEQEASHDSKR